MPQSPFPSEVLASANGGRGVAAFVLRATDLDRMPHIVDEPSDTHSTCRAIQAGEQEAAEEQADALRAEVARLSAAVDDHGTALATAEELIAARDAEVAELREHRDRLIDANERQARQIREQRRTLRRGGFDSPEDDARLGSADRPTLIQHPASFHPSPQHPVALRVYGPGLVEYDGRELRVVYDPADAAEAILAEHDDGIPHEPVDLRPVEDDPRRPHLDHFPEDAILLTYRELRCLVALHLDRYCDPGSGRAMREGDVPLRLSEVLDR